MNIDSMEELLTDLNVAFATTGHHHCRPGWLQLRHCPFCASDSYHLGYNLVGGYFNCWKCGNHHPAKVLRKLGVRDDKELKATLAELGRGKLPELKRERGTLKEPKLLGPLLAPHRRYLRKRGFLPGQLAKLWGLRGLGLAGNLSWRIYIPIQYRGQLVSWTTRSIGDQVQQRYISAGATEELLNHKDIVYGVDHCLHSVVVVEGPTDAWAVGPGAVATFGTAVRAAQVQLLSHFPRRFVCFDSSPPAQAQAEELASQLACFPGTTENIVLDAEDPGSAPVKELKALRRVAKLPEL